MLSSSSPAMTMRLRFAPIMSTKRRRAFNSITRWLAPLAVLLTMAAIAFVVVGVLSGSERPAPRQTTTVKRVRLPKERFHTVRSGEVLSAIADRYETTVERLKRLNPKIDTQVLRPGQKIRLRAQ